MNHNKQRIFQLVAGYSNADAISNEARAIRGIFRDWGYESQIACTERNILPELRADAWTLEQLREEISDNDIVLLHLSIGSAVNDFYKDLKCKRVIKYHNMTPEKFFDALQPRIAVELKWGREQLAKLLGEADVVLAASDYNAREMKELGFKNPKILPLILDFDHLRQPCDQAVYDEYNDGYINLLFVGRGAPNKCIEHLLPALYACQRFVNPRCRLLHVGSWAGTEKYQACITTMARNMRLEDVEFLGSIPQEQLNALYRVADVFVCLSEHEGFCIPLIEAMVNDLPVLAFSAAAVPDTLDGAGVLVEKKDYKLIAELIYRICNDQKLRQGIIEKQQQRLARYESLDLEKELRVHLGALLER